MLYAKLILMAVFWSGVFPAVKITLESMGVFTSLFLRFSLAAAILLALLAWREGAPRRLSPREAALVIGLALLGNTLYNVLFTAGLARVEASRAALIVPTNPAFTALFAALFLKERLGAARSVGIALSLAGALWVLTKGEPAALAAFEVGTGEVLLILCIFIWSAYTLLGYKVMVTLTPLAMITYVMAAGSLPLAIPAWFENQSFAEITWRSWAALAYLVVFGTLIPFLWYAEGVKALGAARAAQFITLLPPLAVAEAVLILGEPFTPALVVGGALVVAGIALTNRPR